MPKHRFGGPWTMEKLRILGQYLGFYTVALSRTSYHTVYIDAFAGSGQCAVKIDGVEKEINGSARIALETKPPFDEYQLLESNPARAEQLRGMVDEYPELNVQIHPRDANQALPSLLSGSWKNRRAVLFLDPYGLEVDWRTVEAIARTRAIDVWFLVSLSGVYRQALLRADALDNGKCDALTRFLGTEEWRDTFYSRDNMDDLFDGPKESRRASWHDIAMFIQKRLKAAYLGGVNNPAILRMGQTPLFALFFAVSNPSPKAMSLAKRVAEEIMR